MSRQRSIRLAMLGIGFLALALFPALVLASNRTGQQQSSPTYNTSDNSALTAGPPMAHGISETSGLVQSFPPDLIGAWQVNSTTYAATHLTWFQQFEGPFAVGACVNIRYIISGSLALTIRTQDAGLCDGNPISRLAHLEGTLVSFPPELTGTWSISATGEVTTLAVVPSTVLVTRFGDFYAGACVGALYDAATRIARAIGTLPLDECGAFTPPGPLSTTAGLVTQAPSGTLFGTWVISDVTLEAITGTTRFDVEHGRLQVGDCARASFIVSGTTHIAVRISSLEDFRCGSTSRPRVAFGNLEALPPTSALIGTWTIGGRDYQVTTDTVLLHGPFTVGQLVQVNFVTMSDGTLLALRIDVKHRVRDDDRRLLRTVGLIDSRPPSPTVAGTWVIASATYQVSDTTQLRGSLEISTCAQVFYRLVDGQRIASRILQQPGFSCTRAGHLPVNNTFGFVVSMPPSGTIGTWSIGGALYDVNASTRISDALGILGVGAYVKVQYVVQNGVNVALRIETHVPPQAGDIDDVGRISGMVPVTDTTPVIEPLSPSVTSLPYNMPDIVYVNGNAYTILDATLVDDTQAALTDGTPVIINAYTSGATRVATSITTLKALYYLDLPFVTR
jgi:hypothetical protein